MPVPPVQPTAHSRLIRTLMRSLGHPHAALIGLSDGLVLAALARALRRQWRHDMTSKPLTVFAWTEPTRAVGIAFHRATRPINPRGKWRAIAFRDMCRLSVARDGTRAKWHAAVEALVLEGVPPFGLVCHTGGGFASDILGDLSVLTPLCDDATIVALLGMSHQEPVLATRRLIEQRGWHMTILQDVALLSRPPVAIPKKEFEHANLAVPA